MRKLGCDLAVGDTVVDLWWQPKGSVVLGSEPYRGKLAHLFPAGASTVEFTAEANRLTGKCKMTVDHGQYFEVVK